MRPPRLAHSWLLLMTSSSLLMAAPSTPTHTINVKNGCPPTPTTCQMPGKNIVANGEEFTCNPGFVLESQSILDDSDVLPSTDAVLKVACYSKCDEKFIKYQCPFGETCEKAQFEPIPKELQCSMSKQLIVNDKIMQFPFTCDGSTGWTDGTATLVVPFTKSTDHLIESFCRDTPPVPPPVCGHESYEDEECTACNTMTFNNGRLSCPSTSSKLMFGSKMFNYATCDPTAGWKGFVTVSGGANQGVQLVAFSSESQPKLRIKCHDFCSDDIVNAACPPIATGANIISCTPKPANKEISCKFATSFLKIGDKFFKKPAVCSKDEWKVATPTPTILVDFTKNPFENIPTGSCEPCWSMVESSCPACTAPTISTGAQKKLECPDNHYLIVDGKEDTPYKELTCTVAGWKSGTNDVLNYKTKIDKLKAKCLSRCHTKFVDTSCPGTCNKPIYSEDETLFCRNADEQLELNGKDVPNDVKCDLNAANVGGSKGGWTDASGTVLVKFSEITTRKVKALCKRGLLPIPTVAPPTVAPPTVAPTTVAPPVRNATDAAAASKGDASGADTAYLIVIGLLVAVMVVGSIVFVWMLKKKRKGGSEDEEEGGHSKTKTTRSDSKNSSKNKKGKKGKKGKKSDGKKSKKNKKNKEKEEEKEKEETKRKKPMEVNSDVEKPEHDMSMENSTIPLTAALVAAPPPPNPNVMDI